MRREFAYTRQTRRCKAVSCALLVGLALAVGGCDRDSAGADQDGTPAEIATPEPVLTRYAFTAGLRGEHAEVADFLKTFLETCLADDYEGYRALVSRQFTPEPRARFESIYQATRAVQIESIEPLATDDDNPALRDTQGPVYLVISSIEFDPEHVAGKHTPNRRIAILVFKEQGEWRMAPAPGSLQPDKPKPTTTSAPAEPEQPDYPWDEQGDD